MGNFNFYEKKFGEYETIVLADEVNGSEFEIALRGATPLTYKINLNGELFNILDGFDTPEELREAHGARCWIMIPFANRIPGGNYKVSGKNYKMDPIPSQKEVIHGFTSYESFSIKKIYSNNNYIETVLNFNKIRPGVFKGYPFALNIEINYKLEKNKITIIVSAENIGHISAPFSTGFHPYFKTSDRGIENLIFTLNANGIILLDENNIPLEKGAFGKLDNFPQYDYRENVPEVNRIIKGRILDICYSNLKMENDGYAKASLFDPDNGLRVIVFQKGGVTLAFSGDSLKKRKRKSLAIEPMQFITNAFNRKELENKILIKPGAKSVFKFGFEISK